MENSLSFEIKYSTDASVHYTRNYVGRDIGGDNFVPVAHIKPNITCMHYEYSSIDMHEMVSCGFCGFNSIIFIEFEYTVQQ